MPINPLLSGSSIIFVSSSNDSWVFTQSYSSSNPTLISLGSASGQWTGTADLHMTYRDYTASGSHSVYGSWTGSTLYYTESGPNSHDIPVGAPSIFTSSYATTASLQDSPPPDGGAYSLMEISMSEDNGFSIAAKAAGGATKDMDILFVKADGKIGVGTDNPTQNFDVASTTNLAKLASPAFTGRITTPDMLATSGTITNLTASLKGCATEISVSADGGNATHYVPFLDSATGCNEPKTDTALNYNPSTNKLTAGYFVGDGSLLTNVGGGGDSDCTVAVNSMPEGAFPIVANTDTSTDGGCETLYGCDKITVDCTNNGIWINGGLLSHDKGTFTFRYGDSTTTIKVGK